MNKDINLENSDKVNLKITYLTFLQNIINRMSTIGIAIKTASVTALTALLAYSASDSVHDSFKPWVFFLPWVFFYGYDAYFLRLERAFRNLYNQSTNQEGISFQDFKIDKHKLNSVYEKWGDIIVSKPLLIFHSILIIVIIVAFVNI